MPTLQQQIVTDATQTLQDACALASVQSPMDALTAANASLAQAQSDLAAKTAALGQSQTDLASMTSARDAAVLSYNDLKTKAQAYLQAEDTLRTAVGA
jgi:hypothetical protein